MKTLVVAALVGLVSSLALGACSLAFPVDDYASGVDAGVDGARDAATLDGDAGAHE